MAPRARGPRHAWYNTRGWRDEQRVSPVIPHSFKLCFLRLWCFNWVPLARAQDRLLGPCFKTGPEGTSILSLPIDSPSPWWRWERRASPETVYAGIHHAPGCTPRTGKPQVAAQAFRTERRYCGTSNQMPRGRCRACSHRWLTVS